MPGLPRCAAYDILLAKLYNLGITGTEHKCFTDYLIYQSVFINGTLSDTLKIYVGVPQGSILGPLLFIIYINDLTSVIDKKCKVVLYANDNSLFYASNNPEDLQSVLNVQLENVENG